MVIPDRMLDNSAHCGPVAIAHALGVRTAQVMADWPDRWTDHRTDRKWWLWPIDTPWNHRAYLARVNRRAVEINQPEPGAIALIHNVNAGRNPITQFLAGLIYQHWVRIVGVAENQVTLDWGTEAAPIRIYDRDSFMRLVNGAWPKSMYRIE